VGFLDGELLLKLGFNEESIEKLLDEFFAVLRELLYPPELIE